MEDETLEPFVHVSGVPTEVADELARLHTRDGALDAREVVRTAADPLNPLHRYFEWDDAAAAEEHRIAQAKSLIRRVRVTVIDVEREPVTVRAYVSEAAVASRGPESNNRYRTLDEINNSPDFQRNLLDTITREINALRAKYAAYADVFEQALEQTNSGSSSKVTV